MDYELFLVSGASGQLGLAFIKELKHEGFDVIGLARRDFNIDNVQILLANLANEGETAKALSGIDVTKYKTITLIHPVGKFKFEKNREQIVDTDKDGIDDEVYSTNVITLKNLLKVLLPKLTHGQHVKIVTFASISDKHDIPYWTSYTKSKNIIRGYLKDLCAQNYIHALMVNVSTVDTGNENLLRPNADKTYWLHPEEIVSQTLIEIKNISSYKEIDLFKEKPDFKEDYYLNHEAILNKWEKEMGTTPNK
jgi:short-subunit dehydrogenase